MRGLNNPGVGGVVGGGGGVGVGVMGVDGGKKEAKGKNSGRETRYGRKREVESGRL